MADLNGVPAKEAAPAGPGEVGERIRNFLARARATAAGDRPPPDSDDILTNFFRALLDSVPANVAVLDGHGTIIYVNRPWQDFARENGIDGMAGIGTNYLDACRSSCGDDAGEASQAYGGIRAVLDGERDHFDLEYPCHSPDRKRWFLMYVTPLDIPRLKGAIVFHIDITARRLAEEGLQDEKARADLYLDILSHDINNLNQAGIGYLELVLGKTALVPEDRELLVRSLTSLEDSSLLIDTVRKLQAGLETKIVPGPVDVARVLDDVLDQYRFFMGKRLVFSRTCPAGCTVLADALLKDVLVNIIANAIKHNPDETVAVNVCLEPATEGGRDYCRIAIEDNGPGIPAELKGRIFGRFQRGPTKAAGRGLGLYLVRELVDRYGGRVWVEDRVPGDHTNGSRFVILLPLAR